MKLRAIHTIRRAITLGKAADLKTGAKAVAPVVEEISPNFEFDADEEEAHFFLRIGAAVQVGGGLFVDPPAKKVAVEEKIEKVSKKVAAEKKTKTAPDSSLSEDKSESLKDDSDTSEGSDDGDDDLVG